MKSVMFDALHGDAAIKDFSSAQALAKGAGLLSRWRRRDRSFARLRNV
jgi:hypothetical protein